VQALNTLNKQTKNLGILGKMFDPNGEWFSKPGRAVENKKPMRSSDWVHGRDGKNCVLEKK